MEDLEALAAYLRGRIGPELMGAIERLSAPYGSPESLNVIITEDDIDMPPSYIARKVAESSNRFGEAVRLSGIAKALAKEAERNYKTAFKIAKGKAPGNNADAREAWAYEQVQSQSDDLSFWDQVATMAEAAELQTRVASESARKLLDKVYSIEKGHARQEHGQSRSDDNEWNW